MGSNENGKMRDACRIPSLTSTWTSMRRSRIQPEVATTIWPLGTAQGTAGPSYHRNSKTKTGRIWSSRYPSNLWVGRWPSFSVLNFDHLLIWKDSRGTWVGVEAKPQHRICQKVWIKQDENWVNLQQSISHGQMTKEKRWKVKRPSFAFLVQVPPN